MNRRRGFTLIEVLTAMVIMLVLLVLAVVSLRSSQMTARDKDREAKAASIAIYLEELYISGADNIYSSSGNMLSLTKGRYPYAGLIANSCNSTCTSAAGDFSTNTDKLEALFGLTSFDLSTLKAPNQNDYSLVVAQSAAPDQQTPTGLTEPTPTYNTFIYQPITYTGLGNDSAQLCNLSTSECRAFNLFYKTESDQVVHKITSKHQ